MHTLLKILGGLSLLSMLAFSAGAQAREVRIYSGRHYNTDRQVFKKFSDEKVNGEVFRMFGDMKAPLGNMKNGKQEV